MSAETSRSRGRFSRLMDRLTGGVDAPTSAELPVQLDDVAEVIEVPHAIEVTEPPDEVRVGRFRNRLGGSFGRSVLGLLGGAAVSELDWDAAESVLLQADLGPSATAQILDGLRRATRAHGNVRDALRALLLDDLDVDGDRGLAFTPTPGVILVVGVNGTGKTTTCGKLAASLVAQGHSVVLGAADTFRAAATQQLQTWGSRVGVPVVTGPEASDPASVAFDTVTRAVAEGATVAIIDTAGRLHTKTGLMDELGKVKRVASKVRPISEVLLVLDATTGQNGLAQARVFSEAVQITGVILTKLDGTAKGGIVFTVQKALGVPVKFVGLGEGVDDLAPFDPEAFVDALLG